MAHDAFIKNEGVTSAGIHHSDFDEVRNAAFLLLLQDDHVI